MKKSCKNPQCPNPENLDVPLYCQACRLKRPNHNFWISLAFGILMLVGYGIFATKQTIVFHSLTNFFTANAIKAD